MIKYNIDLSIDGTTNEEYTGNSEIVFNREGVVIHTATVTDENDASVGKGKVVEFYKNYELLGRAVTNNSGVATLRSTYNIGTYQIAAKIKEFGTISRIHIVNPYNKLPLSVQSGGDIENISNSNYTRSSVFTNNGGSITRSSEWSSTGSTSIKISTNTPANNNWIRFIVPIQNDDLEKNLTFKVKTHIVRGTGLFKIFFVSTGENDEDVYTNKKELTIPKADLNQIEVSEELITNDTKSIVFQFELKQCKEMYIDDLECYFD